MKKSMFLIMLAIMPFVSCNSDDDTHELVIDAIVGEWYQIEKRQLIDGIEKTIPMTSCEKLNSFNIKKNGTTTCSFYFRNDYDYTTPHL